MKRMFRALEETVSKEPTGPARAGRAGTDLVSERRASPSVRGG
jgi:hypothetical protein